MAAIQERVGPRGTTFRAIVRVRGFPIQTASFERKTDAKRWAEKTEAQLRDGRAPLDFEAKKHSVADLIDRYTEDVVAFRKPRSASKLSIQLAWWRKQMGGLKLTEVTPAVIAGARDKLLRGVTPRGTRRTPSTVNRYLAVISHAFSLASREWGWIDRNPFSQVRRSREPRGRVRFLSTEERDRLLEACRQSIAPALYPVVLIALSTGARQAEILELRWRDIHLDRRSIVLDQTKNGERRALPLAGAALDALKELREVRREDTELVFPRPDGKAPFALRYAWDVAVRKADLEDFRFHDLRHTAASYLAMSGATLAEIAEVLGHKTLAMVKRYAHLTDQHVSKVVARMNAQFLGEA